MAFPFAGQPQSDEEFFSWLASQGRGALDFLEESGSRANPAAHPPSNPRKIGDAVRSPEEAAAAMAPPAAVDPLTERLKRQAVMTDDLGLAENQKTAASLDEIDRAYQRGAGNQSEVSPEELRRNLGFSWGKNVDVDPATGRPRSNSTISTFDAARGRTPIAANESQGGGGVSTLGEGPRFRNIQPWQVEDAQGAAAISEAERSVEDPMWLRRAAAGLDVEKAAAIEGNKADIQAGTEAGRREQYIADLNAEDELYRQALGALEGQQRSLPPEEFQRRHARIEQRYQTRRAGVRQAHGFGERLSTASLYAE
jgi:hypothetical protein